jgi:hypothetical protein
MELAGYKSEEYICETRLTVAVSISGDGSHRHHFHRFHTLFSLVRIAEDLTENPGRN